MAVGMTIEGAETFRVARVTLQRAERANSLVPSMVDDLNRRLEEAAGKGVHALVLEAEGRFFSSGGDVAGFAANEDETIIAYADHVVGGLQQAVLTLLRFPAPVLARVQGGVTGGAAGLVVAADLVAMARDAFIQPYYSDVGFAPDGGWTALLPEKISPARALSVQLLNRRIRAKKARKLGLVDAVVDKNELDQTIDQWLAELSGKSAATLQATRRLIWDETRISHVAARLDAEKREFLNLIAKPETRAGMRHFLGAKS